MGESGLDDLSPGDMITSAEPGRALKFIKEAKPIEPSQSGISQLKEKLNGIYPDVPEQERVQTWIQDMEAKGGFKVFSEDLSGIKTALMAPDYPHVVIKRFDKGALQIGFEHEKEEYRIISEKLGKRFLPDCEYVEVPSAPEDRKYYVLQDRLEGRQYKKATSQAQERISATMTEEAIEEQYVKVPENWTRLRGEVLKEGLTEDQWTKAQEEAKSLVSALRALETTDIMNDIDFFITQQGQLKIFDWQVHGINSPEYKPTEFPEGSKEIEILFDVKQ